MKQPIHCFLVLFITIIIYSLFSTSSAQPHRFYPWANISTEWTNNPSLQEYTFDGNVTVRVILLRGTSGPVFGCGFICSGSCKSFLFSIFIVYTRNGDLVPGDEVDRFNYRSVASPRLIWSANRDRTVHENATLEFSQKGNLILMDVDGTQVWSTDTSAKSVVGMEINQVGSLVLFDDKHDTVWSSMDHPTDTLVLGQSLKQGQRLTANVSITNSSQGPAYLSAVRGGYRAFVGSQLYYDLTTFTDQLPTIVRYINGSLSWIVYSNVTVLEGLPMAKSIQYIQLDYRGHLRVYESNSLGWAFLGDVLSGDDCAYPTACGEYGICSNGQCTCPPSPYFSPVDKRNPTAGCKPSTAISCESNKTHQFIYLPNVSYIGVVPRHGEPGEYFKHNLTEETCMEACRVNCSCKAAFFKFYTNASSGQCYLPSEMYSLKYNNPETTLVNSSAFIKVQSLPIANSTSNSKNVNVGVIIGATVGSLLALFLMVVLIIVLVRIRSKDKVFEDDDELIMLPGLPTRFTFEDLRIATNDFLQKLGEGGFGSVFEGTLNDGTKIAVKRLDGVGQGKKEFLAEVETIGSIHHMHLVRLVGFCA